MIAPNKESLLSLVDPSAVFSQQGKPTGVGNPGSDNPTHRAIASERARGKSCFELSETFGMPLTSLERLVAQKWFASLVMKMQSELEMSYDEKLDALSSVALEAQARILHTSSDEKTVMTVSDKILDRAKGKAAQTLNVRSVNLNVNQDLESLDAQMSQTAQRIHELTKYVQGEEAEKSA